MTFDQGGRTMMGVAPESAYRSQVDYGVPPTAFGANCGAGLANNVAAIVEIAAAAAPGAIIVAKPNCGIPVYKDGRVTYDGTPELMGVYARMVRDAGARIIGGCCGSTGAHLGAMVEALEDHVPGPPPSLEQIEAALGPVQRARSPRKGKRKARSA
jgi:5-methyltetrahydrofolate--homocysteine methyltransferase